MYKRPLLKISGEVLSDEKEVISSRFLKRFSKEVKEIREMGVELAILPGGGNIFRGKKGEEQGIERIRGDYMGMLGTVINALALQDAFEKEGIESKIFSPFFLPNISEVYEIEKVVNYLKKGIALLAFGTGYPFFTTDTASALRAVEIKSDILLKATKVRGIYDRDPEKEKEAIFFPSLTFDEILYKNLMVMDLTSITLCKEHGLPLIVFDIKEEGNLKKAILGEKVGTKVGGIHEG